MRITLSLIAIVCSLCLPLLAGADVKAAPQAVQAPAKSAEPNSIIAYNKSMYDGIKMILLRSAEKMPEEFYSFKPTDTVRTYGQILAHVADAQYLFAALVLGEKSPAPHIEKTKTTKADLVAALKEAFAYCDKAYASLNDTTAVQTIKLFGEDAPRLGALMDNNLHTIEHYGNLVTYMRLKNIVPPTSEPGTIPQGK
jgi:uncharacterized damage-inducible protein DinB